MTGFDTSNRGEVRRRVASVKLSDTEFSADIAIGVRNKPKNGRTTWVKLTIVRGRSQGHSVHELPSDALPEDDLKVVVAVAATSETWAAVASEEDFLDAVAFQRFFVTGETPFFIRHLESLLEAIKAFR